MCLQLRTLARLGWHRLRTIKTEETGAELVEAALIIPLLLTFLVGIVSVGRGFNVYQTITRAAREGAKSLVLTTCATCGNTPVSAAEAQWFVDQSLIGANLNPADVCPSPDCPAAPPYTSEYVWLDPTAPVPQECGVAISFSYPSRISFMNYRRQPSE